MNPTVVFPEAREVAIEDRERPEPGPDEVLIETDTSLVSTGTELTVLSGDFPDGSNWDDYAEYPFVAGYTNVGTVVEVGDAVDADAAADAAIEPGTRVATWTPHAAYVTAAAEDCVVVPDAVDDRQAALFAIAQIVMNGIRRGRVSWGETVVVYGLGILGQLAARLAHLAGAETVVGIDIAEQRLDYLPDEPGIVGVNPRERDPAEAVEDATGGRLADVVLEVTGSPAAIPGEFDVLREQGRLVLLSSPHGETTLDFHDLVNGPSHEIIGAHQMSHPPVSTPATPWTKARHAELFFEYLQQGRLSVGDLYTHEVAYDEAPDLYDSLLEDRTDAMAVRLDW
jgi:2-desacetyl-2-hydroxyethyl bacteriochlorophyllide A dehydrogenase